MFWRRFPLDVPPQKSAVAWKDRILLCGRHNTSVIEDYHPRPSSKQIKRCVRVPLKSTIPPAFGMYQAGLRLWIAMVCHHFPLPVRICLKARCLLLHSALTFVLGDLWFYYVGPYGGLWEKTLWASYLPSWWDQPAFRGSSGWSLLLPNVPSMLSLPTLPNLGATSAGSTQSSPLYRTVSTSSGNRRVYSGSRGY